MYDGDLPSTAKGLALGLFGVVPFVPRGPGESGRPDGTPAGPPATTPGRSAEALPDATLASVTVGDVTFGFAQMMTATFAAVLMTVLLVAFFVRLRVGQ